MASRHWLVKQEPTDYSWARFGQDGATAWTGVRNYAARIHLRGMQVGDGVLYYHTGEERQIVGLAKVKRAAYPDPTAEEGDWVAVDLIPVKALRVPVTLASLKAEPVFKDLALLRQPRLSVMPVTASQFERVLVLGGIPPGRRENDAA